MKKFLPAIIILSLIVLIFTLAACGREMKDDVTNELTTLKNNATSMMDDLSSAVSDMAEDLTQGGNITKDNSSTGLVDKMTEEDKTTKPSSSHTTTTRTAQ